MKRMDQAKIPWVYASVLGAVGAVAVLAVGGFSLLAGGQILSARQHA